MRVMSFRHGGSVATAATPPLLPPPPSSSGLDDALDFTLPPGLEADAPPEARGLARDQVRLMASYAQTDRIVHAQFRDIGTFLSAGDLLVINTSGTRGAAINAVRERDGLPVELHLSTQLPAGLWIVEARLPGSRSGAASEPFPDMNPGDLLRLPGSAAATIHLPYRDSSSSSDVNRVRVGPARLWIASLELPTGSSLDAYLAQHGFPIRYRYMRGPWPLDYYQTVYVTEPGSAEMPSAGRAFTPELITALTARGIQFAPLLLHTGVSSLEGNEPPYEEFYRVPVDTARRVNAVRATGGRVVAVGTTSVRALETVTDSDGVTHPGEGWTRLVITPARGLRAIDSLLTGLHEPRATHLQMLAALAGRSHLEKTYAAALRERYLWHEFGDLHLILCS